MLNTMATLSLYPSSLFEGLLALVNDWMMQ